MPGPDLTHVARSRGAIIATVFGTVWLLAWMLSTNSASPAIILSIVAGTLLIAGAAFLQARRLHHMDLEISANHRGRSLRLYGIINAVQWLLIFALAATLATTGHPQWITAVVILIVGLHFLPLAHIFRDRLHYLTGMSLVLLACLYPFASESGPSDPIGLLGAGAILWASAVVAIATNNSSRSKPLRGSA